MKGIARINTCPNCGAPIVKKKAYLFALTFKYKCPDCKQLFMLSTLSNILLTIAGLSTANLLTFYFGVNFILSIFFVGIIISAFAIIFCPITEKKQWGVN